MFEWLCPNVYTYSPFTNNLTIEKLELWLTSLSDTPACNTMMFKLWNTGILASYLFWINNIWCDLYPLVKKLGNVVTLMYTDETVLVLNNPTLFKTLWRLLDVCSWFIDKLTSPLNPINILYNAPHFLELRTLYTYKN
jgi:hypothetical protein